MTPNDHRLLTPQELNLKSYLRFLFFIYLGGVILYLIPGTGIGYSFFKSYPFLIDPAFANNPTIKMGLFAALCFVAAGDVRRYLIAVEAVMVVMCLAVLSGIILVLTTPNNYTVGAGMPIRPAPPISAPLSASARAAR